MGLALASSIAAYLNAGQLYRGLRKAGVYKPLHGWLHVMAAVILATAGMAVGLAWYGGDLAMWIDWAAGERALRMLALVAAGILAYLLLLLLGGLRIRHLEKGSV